MNGNGNKAPWEVKKGLRAVESSNGVHMFNANTPATGMYGQFFNQIEGLPMMEGISREQFGADTTLQNQILDMRWRGDIPDVPSMYRNAEMLQEKYPDQIGDLSFNELAMLSNLTGRKGARDYFASIREDVPFKLSGINKTPEQYIDRIREALKTKKEEATNISNTVPYAAAANDPKKYEDQLDFLNKIFGSKSSLVDSLKNK